MNNPAHPATRTLTHSRVSERPRESKYELDPRGSLHQEHPLRREQVASASVLEEIGRTQVPRRSPCGKLRNRLLQRVLDRMKADLATDLDLSTLAAESGYSRSHFLRMFRARMGCSPHQYLTRLRVDQAKTILREYSVSLIDIALACGFSSHAHFSNTFRQIVGVTPSEYRRTHRPIVQKGFLLATSSFGPSLFSE
jgi:transcriptional regulator GlxA family with amidase domain